MCLWQAEMATIRGCTADLRCALVMVPLHSGSHWRALVIDRESRVAAIWDSLHSTGAADPLIGYVQGWLSQLCCAQLLEDQSPYTVTVVQKAPMQDVSTDKGECAAMVCQFMAHAALGAVGAGLPVEGWCSGRAVREWLLNFLRSAPVGPKQQPKRQAKQQTLQMPKEQPRRQAKRKQEQADV
jgi:hypothetical protein